MDSAKLLTLACIAYRERQFGDAGRLFAASLDAEDSDSLLETLCESMDIDYDAIQQEVDTMISEANSFPSLSEIATALEEGMKEEYVSVGKSEDEEIEDSEASDSEAESAETESSAEETVTEESGSESSDQPEQQSASEASGEADSSEVAEDEIETTSSDEEIQVSSCIKRK